MKDTDPSVIGLHLALGQQVALLDQLETRTFRGRGGLYVAPGIPEIVAQNVALELACAAMETKP